MLRRSLVPCALALASIACTRVSANVDAQPANPSQPGEAEAKRSESHESTALPEYVLLRWDTELFSAPNLDAYVTTLVDPGEGTGYAVKVVGSEGDWWIVETVDSSALTGYADAEPLVGLDFYRLQLYVRAGAGAELHQLPPGPDSPESRAPTDEDRTAEEVALAETVRSSLNGTFGSASFGDPPLQSGIRSGQETDWRVGPQTPVFWPDGRAAGEVRIEHAFVERGTPDESGELLCFHVHAGYDETDAGQLCFARQTVRESEVMYPDGMYGDWGGLVGTEVGDAYGVGGLGLVGRGEGGGGTAEGVGSVGLIGHGEGAGGGSGYGSGSGSFGSTKVTSVKITAPKTTGKLDADITRRIIRAHINEARQCWDAEKPAGATTGKLSLTLEIDVDGSVTKVSSKPESKDQDAVARCLDKQAAKWKFVRDGEGSATLEFSFSQT